MMKDIGVIMMWDIRYLIAVSYRLIRSRRILDRRHYWRRNHGLDYRRAARFRDRRDPYLGSGGRRRSNAEYKWMKTR